MDEIATECGDSFPLFRTDTQRQWMLSTRGSWLGGFWAGLWWRRYTCTGSMEDRAAAWAWSSRLRPMLLVPSVNRSFVFWYGAAIGHREVNDDREAGMLAAQAALAIAQDFDPSMGACAVGIGMGVGEAGRHRIDVDALAPTLALLHDYGGSDGGVVARRHLWSCMRHLAAGRGAWRASAVLCADGRVAPQDEAGAWPRGQAWAMLGMAEAVRLYGRLYWEAALQTCTYWCDRWGSEQSRLEPQPVQEDPSAQAIAAVAMLNLFRFLPEQTWLRQQALAQIEIVLANPQVTERGRFVGHRYCIAPGTESLVESPCAMFFLLEAVLSS
jgi:unsaturated chondroitin disaccharide hydrolase